MYFDEYYAITTYPIMIEHYGVKGMKWGVWNEETKARRSGSSASFKDKAKAFAGSKQGKIIIGTAAMAAIAGTAVLTGVGPAAISSGAKAVSSLIASGGVKMVADTVQKTAISTAAKAASKPIVKKAASKLSGKVTKDSVKRALKTAAVTGSIDLVVDQGRDALTNYFKNKVKGSKSNAAE